MPLDKKQTSSFSLNWLKKNNFLISKSNSDHHHERKHLKNSAIS